MAMVRKTSIYANAASQKPPHMQGLDSTQNNRSIGSVLPRNHEEMFYKFDSHGTTPRSLAIIYDTPERVVCEIIRHRYHGLIQRARRIA